MNGTDPKFARWYDRNAALDDDFTWGEEVWKAARRELLKEQRKRRESRRGRKGRA